MMSTLKSILRRFVASIPYKKQLFECIKYFYTPPHSLYRHMWFTGEFVVESGDAVFNMVNYNSALETATFWRGVEGHEKESMRAWILLCKHSSVILDVGASTGLYALVAKAVNPRAEVYAFEPLSRIFKKLKLNCDLNAFDIACFDYAISNRDSIVYLYDLPERHHSRASLHQAEVAHLTPEVIKRKVLAKRLDTISKEQNIHQIDLLKIDVEGHESFVLEGLGEHLVRDKPAILLEVKTKSKAFRIQEMVGGLDYLYFDIDENNGIKRVQELSVSSTRNYLLCNSFLAGQVGLI